MTLDHDLAQQKFREATEIASDKKWKPQSPWIDEINEIISGTHKTYRYVLITGLLAKATDPDINPLTLQAGSTLDGAYDARSLCHKVVVPLERELLSNSLGGSNEPFLNKPARFPEISLTNAVRKGSDLKTLHKLHGILSSIESPDTAFTGLTDALFFTFQRTERLLEGLDAPASERTNERGELLDFLASLTSLSIEGQTSALATGATLDLHFLATSTDFETIVHPVNQSGASSKEIADIDVRKAGKSYLAVEVKDKDFSLEDVDHAAQKNGQAGLNSMIFVKGPRGKATGHTEEEILIKIRESGIDVTFVDLLDFCRTLLALTPDVSGKCLMHTILKHAEHARVKDEVMEHIRQVYQESDLKE